MTSYCTELANTLFPSKNSLNQRQIDKIDKSLVGLYENMSEKQNKLKDLKNDLFLLNDKTKKVDPNGLPRKTLIENTRKRMKTMLIGIKGLQNNIHFFEQVKYNLENSHMTAEMAAQVKSLKQQLVSAGAIDIDKLKDDVDDIAEINDDIQDVNLIMNDTMTNAWSADMDTAEDLLEEFLADSDVEDEDDIEINEEYVKPIVDILTVKNKKISKLPNVPKSEPDVIQIDDPADDKELVHDF